MPPNTRELTGVLDEHDVESTDGGLVHDITPLLGAEKTKTELIWPNIIVFFTAHLQAFYGIYLIGTSASVLTPLFTFCLYVACGMGISAGVHRLFSHRSFKAKIQLRILLAFLFTMSYENSVIHWVREHRVHHKYCDTDADPVNSKRGFFFSHMGWLMCKKHPDVKRKGAGVDISDVTSDPVLAFQKKYYAPLVITFAILMPWAIPVYGWNESWSNSWFIAVMLRWVFTLHCTWLVNSAAHKFGTKPYDKRMTPVNNPVNSVLTFGEGYHNYHHVFPWDYRTSEWGNTGLNITVIFIEFMEKIGWAYDLKKVTNEEMIKQRVFRTGDGTHEVWSDVGKQDSGNIYNKKEFFNEPTEVNNRFMRTHRR